MGKFVRHFCVDCTQARSVLYTGGGDLGCWAELRAQYVAVCAGVWSAVPCLVGIEYLTFPIVLGGEKKE